jgi:hypothetical protein
MSVFQILSSIMRVLNHAKSSGMHPRMKCDRNIHYHETQMHEIMQMQPQMIWTVASLVPNLRQGNDS